MNEHLEEAIDTFRRSAARYERAERYYDGRHDLTFATEKFQNTFGTLFREFAMNLCPAIVDAVRDKLRITGFGTSDLGRHRDASPAASETADSADVDQTGRRLSRIWLGNRMPLRAGELHGEALKTGDAYAIVWPDEEGRACVYPNRAASVSVIYDDERPWHITRAAKYWLTADRHMRINLFYPDRIEKFVTRQRNEGILPGADSFVPIDAGDEGSDTARAAVVPNPYGVVPVFHFANNASIGSPGRSEIEPAIPIQDGLNKAVLDMLVAMEFSAFRQRWIAGLEVETDPSSGRPIVPFQAGIERLWIAANSETKFGDFNVADLVQFLKVKDSFRIDMASVTGTPLHYFLQAPGDHPSGESLKKSETRFLAKVRDRQLSFGQVWADVMAFALRIEGAGADIHLVTQWEDPSPMTERERLENLLLKQRLGLPAEDALIEAGYGAEDAAEMLDRRDAVERSVAAVQQ